MYFEHRVGRLPHRSRHGEINIRFGLGQQMQAIRLGSRGITVNSGNSVISIGPEGIRLEREAPRRRGAREQGEERIVYRRLYNDEVREQFFVGLASNDMSLSEDSSERFFQNQFESDYDEEFEDQFEDEPFYDYYEEQPPEQRKEPGLTPEEINSIPSFVYGQKPKKKKSNKVVSRKREVSRQPKKDMPIRKKVRVTVDQPKGREKDREKERCKDKQKDKDKGRGSKQRGVTQEKASRVFSPQRRELSQRQKEPCTICLCEYKQGERLKELPCRHRYHKQCIDRWLSSSGACPLCKDAIMRH